MKKAFIILLIVYIPLQIHDSSVRKIDIELPVRVEYMGLADPALLARLIIVESNANPQAISNNGAIGMCQIMPSLARRLGYDPGRLMDADYNIMIGSRWLQSLINKYGVDGALRAYLCGETNRSAWGSAEADAYVRRILG